MSCTATGVETFELVQPRDRERRHSNPHTLATDIGNSSDATPKNVHSHPTYPDHPTTCLQFRRDKIWSQWIPDFSIYRVDLTDPSLKTTLRRPAYYAAVSEWSPNTPDVTLHEYHTRSTSDALATAHFRYSRHVKMSLNPSPAITTDNEETQAVYEEMRNTSTWPFHDQYTFSLDSNILFDQTDPLDGYHHSSPSTSTNHDVLDDKPFEPRRRQFQWLRTRSPDDGVHGFWKSLSFRHYKLVDVASGEVLAVYIAQPWGGWKKMGELKFTDTLQRQSSPWGGPEFEAVVVLSAATIAEKAIRRCRKYSRRVGGP